MKQSFEFQKGSFNNMISISVLHFSPLSLFLDYSMGLGVLNWIPFPHETAIDLFYIHGWFFFVLSVSFSLMWMVCASSFFWKKKETKIENDFHRSLHFKKNLLTWYNHNHHSQAHFTHSFICTFMSASAPICMCMWGFKKGRKSAHLLCLPMEIM